MAQFKTTDSRYVVWVVEAKMSDGTWFPMPDWGAGSRRKSALRNCVEYCVERKIAWALDKTWGRHSRRIRARRIQ